METSASFEARSAPSSYPTLDNCVRRVKARFPSGGQGPPGKGLLQPVAIVAMKEVTRSSKPTV